MKLEILKSEFKTIESDENGSYIIGSLNDFEFIKDCAKNEFNIIIEKITIDDNEIKNKYYFNIID